MISQDMVIQYIASFVKLPTHKIQPDMHINDIVADSFLLVEMVLSLQEDFNILLDSDDFVGIESIADLTTLVQNKCLQTKH